MNVTVLQENLIKGVSRVVKIISSKPQMPILSSLYLTTEPGSIRIIGTNLETTIQTTVPAKVIKEGSMCVPAKLFQEFLSTLSKDTVTINVEQENVSVSCGKSKATMPGFLPGEFPPVPAIENKTGTDIKKEDFLKAVSSVLFSAASDEARPMLMGIKIEKRKDQTALVTTDGYRLSVSAIEEENILASEFLVIPSRAMAEVVRIGGEEKEEQLLRLTETVDGQLVFTLGETSLSTRRIEGDFPNYRKIIPTQHTTEVSVDKEEFTRAVKSASLFARDSAGIIKFGFGENEITVTANTPQVGENTVEVEAETEGETVSVAINSRFLLDLLSHIQTGRLSMQLTGSLNPVVFTTEDKNFLHIIMPVRVEN